ncbi:MAG: LolA-like outer membrane lipoprotein chaperone [Arcobacter sp.]|jgi:outer membrane lipoprotein carrier protein|uniref:Periplasmic outer membrane-specific lipoprotein chaperone n=1 Tax=Arcobacter defluvii TaxID=873191 RepID=A0AAE7E7J2_9BACT|nr:MULTISPECIES: LolA-like outer membrane lipoprotein chaperone [Arcobacter]MDY3199727.1 LolA-like outer membrane lipoprotein chaperone [Arcobacter sp.]QKF77423.1 periplasmic outer membrane-specific lipoprotein chaperone [Arcobacter defluvii]RXI32118.1 cell envelope biogenesis protein LolA [Arcobacter defluvii]BAK73271.1 outer membrane lipoprotein carrier protein LolA [Arcobacter sp. L]
MFYKSLILLVLFCISCVASSDIRNLDSFKASFTQIITSSSNNIIEYKGEVFIKKSGKILWKYETPVVKNVYINNDFAIVDEPELEQAIFTQLESEINIIKLLNTSKKMDNDTYSTNIDDVEYLITLSKNDEKIKEIKYKDKLENNVEIKFSNVIQNGEISDEIFKFIVPEYYDIIRK